MVSIFEFLGLRISGFNFRISGFIDFWFQFLDFWFRGFLVLIFGSSFLRILCLNFWIPGLARVFRSNFEILQIFCLNFWISGFYVFLWSVFVFLVLWIFCFNF